MVNLISIDQLRALNRWMIRELGMNSPIKLLLTNLNWLSCS
jgi:hypothetical protein